LVVEAWVRTSAARPENVSTEAAEPLSAKPELALAPPTLLETAKAAPLNVPVPDQPQAPVPAQVVQTPWKWPSAAPVPSPSLHTPLVNRNRFKVPLALPRRPLSVIDAAVA